MANLDYKPFAERHRPHIHPVNGILFLTFRLAGSIPKSTVREYKAKRDWLANELKRVEKLAEGGERVGLEQLLEQIEKFNRAWFVRFETILHQAKVGPLWLQDDRVAAKVAENLHRLDGDAYRLDAYCVMSNHIHAVFKPLLSEAELKEVYDDEGHLKFTSQHPGLARIMHSIKGRTARECNLILGRSGQFWEHESFDHVIRPGKFEATIRYVLNNPVKAGLVKDWSDWPWNYCRRGLSDKL